MFFGSSHHTAAAAAPSPAAPAYDRWGRIAFGPLFDVRHNTVFTYHAHAEREKTLQQQLDSSQPGTDTLTLERQIKSSRKWGTKWHELLKTANQIHADLGDLSLSAPADPVIAETEIRARITTVLERKDALDKKAPRTDNDAYETARVKLNASWYNEERSKCLMYGWPTTRIDAERS